MKNILHKKLVYNSSKFRKFFYRLLSLFHLLIFTFLILFFFTVYSCKKDKKVDDDIIKTSSIVDIRDGRVYRTVNIGEQWWMAENLNYGTMIDSTEEQSDNGVPEKYCYKDKEENCEIYGGLYHWDEIMDYSTTPGSQGLCPTGWHIPTENDWEILKKFLGGSTVAGGKMKEPGTTHWIHPNAEATNSSGFTALPGGYISSLYGFAHLGYNARFWSSTLHPHYDQIVLTKLTYTSGRFSKNLRSKYWNHSVRCVYDNIYSSE